MKVELKLVQVQVFFRHGARTPIHYVKSPVAEAHWTSETTRDFPETLIPVKFTDIDGDPVEQTFDALNQHKVLPGGEPIGMLTTQGQKDMYDLGNRLRETYSGTPGILSNPPKITEIEMRSTRVLRNLKSMRALVAGLTGGQIDGTLVIPSMEFEKELLLPNFRTKMDTESLYEGTEELRRNVCLNELKANIKKILKVDLLVDEFDADPKKYSRDCQVYYVRDDYFARKYNGFEVPKGLLELEGDIDHYSTVEILSELLGKREKWKTKLDINIGPVLYIILSKMHNYANIPPLHLTAVHDFTILLILFVLESCDETWPPFGADVIFELYLQTLGSSQEPAGVSAIPEGPPNSRFDWSIIPLEKLWVRVLYLGRPLPLASIWLEDDGVIKQLTGSIEFIPLAEFVRRLIPIALSFEDYQAKCQTNARKHGLDNRTPRGPVVV